MASWRFLLLISVCVILSGHAQVFESSPGFIKVHEGEDADLIWTTRDEIIPWELIQSFFHTTVHNDNILVVVYAGANPSTFHECKDRCEHLRGTHEIGIRIPNVTTADAKSKYIIVLKIDIQGQNGDAVIYIYEKPDQAQLTSDHMTEGNDLSLTCISRSNSLPEQFRPNVSMTYKWTRNDQDISESPPDRHSFEDNERKVLTISDIATGDCGSAYKCIGQEKGSRLESDESEAYVIDVRCKPSSPTELFSEATARSLTLSWTPGWDGGTPQTFTITYSAEEFEKTIPDIPDSPDSSRISYTLTEGISARKHYFVTLKAVNSQGSSGVSWISIATPAGDGDSTNIGLIMGVVAGLLVLIALCVVAFFVIQKFRKLKEADDVELDPKQCAIT
ncbi:hypothetical protein CAPTEDRAFT_193401 [Capitella teleta]|uniref:Fibronectin type-III domain-containing protein n=1 Tax=Capitella teleta TaxID=283909 RepID=R7U2P9_CAPTE|nr:hypothetical protein CAPTEDRAFT_193401 [Capitella teleta]|eukprot:ELT97445.1 hypothetical protein CAPTEDRAFT_193401 [Capitella teleta]